MPLHRSPMSLFPLPKPLEPIRDQIDVLMWVHDVQELWGDVPYRWEIRGELKLEEATFVAAGRAADEVKRLFDGLDRVAVYTAELCTEIENKFMLNAEPYPWGRAAILRLRVIGPIS